MIKILDKKNIPYFVFIILIFLSFVLSFVIFMTKDYGKRKIFIFPSAEEGKFVVEYRYLNKSGNDLLEYYINEILLGSGIERTKKLFTAGTKIESCFLQGNTLYLNLSDNLILEGQDVIDIKSGTELLEQNIKRNFPKVKNVKLFVGGKSAFEN